MNYRLATHVGSGMVAFTLSERGLAILREKGGLQDFVGFQDMTEVNLWQEMPGIYSLRIARRGGRAITIPARHCEGVGQFEDRGGEYCAFARRLHELAHGDNPSIRFTAGSSLLYWLGWFFLVFGVLFVTFLGYALFFGPKPPPRLVFAIAPVVLLVGGAFVEQGRAKPYPPDAPPRKFLPC